MKLASENYGFDSLLPDDQAEMKIEGSAKMFQILSDFIYKDKIQTVVRELSCNAYDAMVDAGKSDVPFKLGLPTFFSQTFFVEDTGTGIPPEKIKDIYWTYGKSTKEQRNDQIGALGLGCKSPFAYTKSSFIVKNRYDGVEYVYFCYFNDKGVPSGTLTSSEPTSLPNGIRVEFAVKPGDILAFENRTKRFFRYWEAALPNIVHSSEETEAPVPEGFIVRPVKVIYGNGWYLESGRPYDAKQGAIALMGNVPYPIDSSAIPNLPSHLALIANSNFVIRFDMGSIVFSSSREELQYDEFTCKNIVERLTEVSDNLAKSFNEKIFDSKQSRYEFFLNFRKVFNQTRELLKADAKAFQAMLFGKSEVVNFDGIDYKIADLLESIIDLKLDGYSSYCVFSTYKTSKGKIRRGASAVTLEATPIEKQEFRIEGRSTSREVWDVSYTHKFAWRPESYRPRSISLYADYASQNHDKFEYATGIKLKLMASTENVFVLNDCGSSGDARFNCLMVEEHEKANYFLVNFRDSTVDEVKKRLLADFDLIDGVKVVLLSTLPDYRPQIEKVARPKNVLKLKVMVISFIGSQQPEFEGFTYSCSFAKWHVVDELIDLDSLKGQKVLFVGKRRSHTDFYTLPDSQQTHLVASNPAVIGILHKEGAYDQLLKIDTAQKKSTLRVLALTQGQLAELKVKHKLDVESLQDYSAAKATELMKKYNVQEIISSREKLSSIDLVADFEAVIRANGSYHKEFIAELMCYHESPLLNDVKELMKISTDPKLPTYFAIDHLNKIFFGRNRASSTNSKVHVKRYPMLEHVEVTTMKIFKTAFQYIKLVDAAAQEPVEATKDSEDAVVF